MLHRDFPEYRVWRSMRRRCVDTRRHNYNRYGGRGIKICERWNDFDLFLQDMGSRPSADHSLDRIDNDGNYEPGNCRWATRDEQNRNRRYANHDFGVSGISQHARSVKLDPHLVHVRLSRGWTMDEALNHPPRSYRRRAANDKGELGIQ